MIVDERLQFFWYNVRMSKPTKILNVEDGPYTVYRWNKIACDRFNNRFGNSKFNLINFKKYFMEAWEDTEIRTIDEIQDIIEIDCHENNHLFDYWQSDSDGEREVNSNSKFVAELKKCFEMIFEFCTTDWDNFLSDNPYRYYPTLEYNISNVDDKNSLIAGIFAYHKKDHLFYPLSYYYKDKSKEKSELKREFFPLDEVKTNFPNLNNSDFLPYLHEAGQELLQPLKIPAFGELQFHHIYELITAQEDIQHSLKNFPRFFNKVHPGGVYYQNFRY
jgi:hypothetical protein